MQEEKLHEKSQRIIALESEVKDLKRLLGDSESQRESLLEEIGHLRNALRELTEGPPRGLQQQQLQESLDGSPGGNAIRKLPGKRKESVVEQVMALPPDTKHSNMSDRAKATLMNLRMERNEQIMRKQAEAVRKHSLLTLIASSNVRKQCEVLKKEFSDQMGRAVNILVSSGIRLLELQGKAPVTVKKEDHQPISSEHPVAKKIGEICDSLDMVVSVLHEQWQTFDCFTRGPVPTLRPARRYLDPEVNLASYINLGSRLRQYVTFAAAVNLVTSEMRLPNVIYSSETSVMIANQHFVEKLDDLFSAMRLLRSPFNSRKHTMSLALRIAMTVEVTRDEIKKLLDHFNGLARDHVNRCFQYIYHTVRIGRRFAAVRKLRNEKRLMKVDEDGELIEHMVNYKYMGDPTFHRCDFCGVGMGCEDCSVVQGHDGELRELIEERRRLIQLFTSRRVEHFAELSHIVDEMMKILMRYKIGAPPVAQSRRNVQNAAEFTTTRMVAEGVRHVQTRQQQMKLQQQYGSSSRTYAVTPQLNSPAALGPQTPNCPTRPQELAFPVKITLGNTADRNSADMFTEERMDRGRRGSVSPSALGGPPVTAGSGGGSRRPSLAYSALHHSAPGEQPQSARVMVSPPAATTAPVESTQSIVGPFGESFFSSDFYFRSKRLYNSQQEQRKVLASNYEALDHTSSMPRQDRSDPLRTTLFLITTGRLNGDAPTTADGDVRRNKHRAISAQSERSMHVARQDDGAVALPRLPPAPPKSAR